MSETPVRSQTYAWFVVGVLVLVALVSYVDRQIVAIVVGPMKQDLRVSDSQIGWLYGIFAIFYAIAGIPIAWLADRTHRTRLIAAGILFWSLATMACGLSRTFWQVLIARIGVGVGEASLVPTANSLISDFFPRETIPLAVSVFQSGTIMGSAIAFIVGGLALSFAEAGGSAAIPVLSDLQPWQQVFVFVGMPGLILAPLLLMLREPRRRSVPPRPAAGQRSDFVEFYRQNRTTIVLHHLGYLSLSLMGFGFVFWTVSYFVRVHGLAAASAAQTFGWIFLLAGPLGGILVAMLGRRLTRAGRRDANVIAPMIGAAAYMPIVLLIQLMPTPALAFALYVPAMLTLNSPFGLAYGSLPLIAPPHLRARVVSVFMFVISLGMLLGPPITGMFNERLFPEQDGVRHSLMAVTLVFGTLGLCLLALCRRHYASSLERAEQQYPEGGLLAYPAARA